MFPSPIYPFAGIDSHLGVIILIQKTLACDLKLPPFVVLPFGIQTADTVGNSHAYQRSCEACDKYHGIPPGLLAGDQPAHYGCGRGPAKEDAYLKDLVFPLHPSARCTVAHCPRQHAKQADQDYGASRQLEFRRAVEERALILSHVLIRSFCCEETLTCMRKCADVDDNPPPVVDVLIYLFLGSFRCHEFDAVRRLELVLIRGCLRILIVGLVDNLLGYLEHRVEELRIRAEARCYAGLKDQATDSNNGTILSLNRDGLREWFCDGFCVDAIGRSCSYRNCGVGVLLLVGQSH